MSNSIWPDSRPIVDSKFICIPFVCITTIIPTGGKMTIAKLKYCGQNFEKPFKHIASISKHNYWHLNFVFIFHIIQSNAKNAQKPLKTAKNAKLNQNTVRSKLHLQVCRVHSRYTELTILWNYNGTLLVLKTLLKTHILSLYAKIV